MKIGIDARFYGPIGKGLGRYTQKLVDYLQQIDQKNTYYIFLKEENFNTFKITNNNFHKVKANYKWYTLSEQINFPRLINKYNLDLMHFLHFNVPYFYNRKFVVTIHDLILFHFPTIKNTTLNPILYKLKHYLYLKIINNAIKKSSKIITISKFTKNDIVSNFKIKPDKISITYEACDISKINSCSNKNILKQKFNITTPFILYVGNAYPHKNLEKLVHVFNSISKKIPNLKLVLVGKKDYFFTRLEEYSKKYPKIKDKLIFPGFVSDCELQTLYQSASIYIFPSLYEGFGLPPLEAIANNLPVACSNSSCLPEILQDAALYFDPKNELDIEKKTLLLLQDNKTREKLITKGQNLLTKYSWKTCAQETLDIYESTK